MAVRNLSFPDTVDSVPNRVDIKKHPVIKSSLLSQSLVQDAFVRQKRSLFKQNCPSAFHAAKLQQNLKPCHKTSENYQPPNSRCSKWSDNKNPAEFSTRRDFLVSVLSAFVICVRCLSHLCCGCCWSLRLCCGCLSLRSWWSCLNLRLSFWWSYLSSWWSWWSCCGFR